jgi:hypothetical protein
MVVLLVGLGALALRGSSAWTLLLLGPALWLFAMGAVMPITGAGFFAGQLFGNVWLVNASYLGVALAYATLLIAGRLLWRAGRGAAAPAPDRTGRRPLLAGLAGLAASYAVVGWTWRQGAPVSTLPLAQVKLRFGEFAVASLAKLAPDPVWVQANIVTRSVPLLGRVRCHRVVVADLAGAMAEVRRQHLEALVDVTAFKRSGGCLQQRRGAQGGLSPQSWGIALDLARARTASHDRRLVAVMARHGFTWGGRWLQPAAGRFEWVGAAA